jgi:hypothetical protein
MKSIGMGIIPLENERAELPFRVTGEGHLPMGKGLSIGKVTTN